MASRIKAIQAYRPRIKLERTTKTKRLAAHVAKNSTFSKGEVVYMLGMLSEAIVHFNRDGRGVKLEGLGTYLPNMRLDGTLDVQHRLDWELRRELNRPDRKFSGTILNHRNIGKTPDELVAQWNADHPDDPVTD